MRVSLIDRRKRWDQIPQLMGWVEVHETAFEIHNAYISGQRKGGVVILHWGNQEMEEVHSDNNEILMIQLSVAVCQSGGRIVGFSGGAASRAVQEMTKRLEEAEFSRGHHFVISPWLANLSHLLEWEVLRRMVGSGAETLSRTWRVDSLLPLSGELLTGLRILCEGFIAARAAQGLVVDIQPALTGMGWRELINRLAPAEVSALAGAVAKTAELSWWTKALGGQRELALTVAKREWGERKGNWNAVALLIKELWTPGTSADFCRLVVDAFLALSEENL